MLTRTQEQILQLLLERQEEMLSIRQISRLLDKSYTLTYNNIKNLLKRGILVKHSLPPAQMIKLNAPISILIDMERKRTGSFLAKHLWIKLYLNDFLSDAKSPFFILAVFGSYAKGKETKGSDIDLLIIVPKREDIAFFEQSAKQFTKVKKGIIVIDAQNFTEMIKNTEVLNVGNEAKKHHIILYGAEQYYQLLK